MWDEAAVDTLLDRYDSSDIGTVWARLLERVRGQHGSSADAPASVMDRGLVMWLSLLATGQG